MADLNMTFNAQDVVPATSFDPVPPGKYMAFISDSSVRETKNGLGQYLKLTFQILGSEQDARYEGRLIFENVMLRHPNTATVQIAFKRLSALCRAVGVLSGLTDSIQLHKKPMQIKVKINPAKDGYDPSNSICAFESHQAAKEQPKASSSSWPNLAPHASQGHGEESWKGGVPF